MDVRIGLDVSAVPPHPGGAGRYIVELAHRLPAADREVLLVARRGDGARWAGPHRLADEIVPRARPARLAYERLALGRAAALRRVDLFHSPHYTMPRGAPVPVVVTIHDMTFFTCPSWHQPSKVWVFQRAIRTAAERADALIAVSETTAALLRAMCPPRGPVVVAPHGVDLDRFRPSDEPAASGPPYLLFVGTFEPRKGIDVLLPAFAAVADAHPDLELWLAGQDGWGVRSIEASLATHPFRDRIRRLGYVTDDRLAVLLQGAAAVAYPSRGEGFGLPVLEAMACGAVTVTTSGTAMAEVAGDAAVLCVPGDAADLANALTRALALTDRERGELGRRARARAGEYTWARSIDRHLEAYAAARDARGA